MLNRAERPKLVNLLVTPSLACSFAANYHLILNLPQPAFIWPCGSAGRATVICSGGRGVVRDFFSFSVWAHFLSRVFAQKILFGIFIQNFNIPHLNHYIFSISVRLALSVSVSLSAANSLS